MAPHEIAMILLRSYVRMYMQEHGYLFAARAAREQLDIVQCALTQLQREVVVWRNAHARAMEQVVEYEKQLGLRKEAQ